MSTTRKNVVLFITDGHRKDTVGCYGSGPAQTPCIDTFAAGGVRFEQAFCTHSVCMPTRASIYTGRYPHVHGVWANGVRLRDSEVTLAQVLAQAGYATGAAGKIHFDPQQSYTEAHIDAKPQQAYPDELCPVVETPYYGFEEVHLSENFLGVEYVEFIQREFPDLLDRVKARQRVPEEAHELTWITGQAIGFIERQAGAGRPFFCHCSFHELIPPCNPPDGFAGHHDPADVSVPLLREDDLARRPAFYRQCYEGYVRNGTQPDQATLRQYVAGYYDQARFIDKQFGRVLDALQRLGIRDDTIVVFCADHGLSLCDHWQWRHGPFMFDQVINVPMVWHVPGVASAGHVTQAMVEGVDIMPTVLDLCGVACPPGVQGRSMAPILRGEDQTGRESVLIQEREAPDLSARGLEPDSVCQYGVRTSDWKFIHYPGQTCGEMYDLRNDPGEFVNLWGEPGYQPQRLAMEHLLLERLLASQDPLPVRQYDW